MLVAEVTQVSLGVGYEIGRAVAMNKHILCLYRPQSDKSMKYFVVKVCWVLSCVCTELSAMVRGAEDGERVKVLDYNEDQLETILKDYFKTADLQS